MTVPKHRNLRQEGSWWEQAAGMYLSGQGYEILAHNFRCRQGEVDLVAREGGYLVFVEVKRRAGRAQGGAAAAVDVRKQRRISRAAMFYLTRHGYGPDTAVRFDVVAIDGDQIRLIRDAFTFQTGRGSVW